MAVKKAVPSVVVPPKQFGLPAGRLAELQAETNLPQPYVVTETITIIPPTKERADKMRESQMAMMVYSQLLNEAIARTVTEEEINTLTKYVNDADRSYNEALFGDQYENVIEFFAAQDNRLWKAFEVDIQRQFFPNQPADGKCPTCGHVTDQEEAGKAPESSPSSNTGGTT